MNVYRSIRRQKCVFHFELFNGAQCCQLSVSFVDISAITNNFEVIFCVYGILCHNFTMSYKILQLWKFFWVGEDCMLFNFIISPDIY